MYVYKTENGMIKYHNLINTIRPAVKTRKAVIVMGGKCSTRILLAGTLNPKKSIIQVMIKYIRTLANFHPHSLKYPVNK